MNFANVMTALSVLFGLLSAAAWFRAGTVKITYEQALILRRKRAKKEGGISNLAGVIINGYEVAETQAAQTRWNAIGAVAAGVAMLLQAIAQLLPCN